MYIRLGYSFAQSVSADYGSEEDDDESDDESDEWYTPWMRPVPPPSQATGGVAEPGGPGAAEPGGPGAAEPGGPAGVDYEKVRVALQEVAELLGGHAELPVQTEGGVGMTLHFDPRAKLTEIQAEIRAALYPLGAVDIDRVLLAATNLSRKLAKSGGELTAYRMDVVLPTPGWHLSREGILVRGDAPQRRPEQPSIAQTREQRRAELLAELEEAKAQRDALRQAAAAEERAIRAEEEAAQLRAQLDAIRRAEETARWRAEHVGRTQRERTEHRAIERLAARYDVAPAKAEQIIASALERAHQADERRRAARRARYLRTGQ